MRALVRQGGWGAGQRGRLLEGEAHHLRVRRAREGDTVELRDGFGFVGLGRLVRSGDDWDVEVERAERVPPPAPLVLAVGAGDRDRFAWLVEKAGELGVTAIVPLETERTGGVATRLRAGQLDRLRRQALETVKQSGTPWACTVEAPATLDELLRRTHAGDRWLADPAGAPPAATLDERACTVLVGPEGGLTEHERRSTLDAGFRATALGPHVLRFETAALAAAAAVQAARLRVRHG